MRLLLLEGRHDRVAVAARHELAGHGGGCKGGLGGGGVQAVCKRGAGGVQAGWRQGGAAGGGGLGCRVWDARD